jgi:uncharacterized protein YceK
MLLQMTARALDVFATARGTAAFRGCLVLFLLSSCGTGTVRHQGWGTPPPYSGVRYDLSSLSQVKHCVATAPWITKVGTLVSTPVMLVDLPLSFLADTVLLPWDSWGERGSWYAPPNELCPGSE